LVVGILGCAVGGGDGGYYQHVTAGRAD
jgi:hypothetical protein